MCKEKKNEEKTSRNYENVKKVREKSKSETYCYNCGKKGHISDECYSKQKCFNCQGFNHIAADCKQPKRTGSSHGRRQRGNYQGNYRGRGSRCGRGQEEVLMRTTNEVVMTVIKQTCVRNTTEEEQKCTVSYKNKNSVWLLDSGSTSHMTCNMKIFDRLEKDQRDISLADKEGRKLISEGIGEVVMKQPTVNNRVRLKNVLCVPDLNTNLLSVAKFTDFGYKVEFDRNGVTIYKKKDEIHMKAVREGNGYYVKSMIINDELVTTTKEDSIWHRRLGHGNSKVIEDMKTQDLVIGMKESNKLDTQCEFCVEGKACRKVHKRLENRRTRRKKVHIYDYR